MRLILAALLGLGVAGAAGCRVHRGHVHGPAVVIAGGHHHSDHCGHYYHRGHWYHHHGHVHRAGCGHHFRGGMWIVID